MTISDALVLLGRLRCLQIHRRSATCYGEIGFGRISVRRKRGESLEQMIVRLAVKVAPFARELSPEERWLLYSHPKTIA